MSENGISDAKTEGKDERPKSMDPARDYGEGHDRSSAPSVEGKEGWVGFLVDVKDDGNILPKEMTSSVIGVAFPVRLKARTESRSVK